MSFRLKIPVKKDIYILQRLSQIRGHERGADPGNNRD